MESKPLISRSPSVFLLEKWHVNYQFCLPEVTSRDWITHTRKAPPGPVSHFRAQIPEQAQGPSLQPQPPGPHPLHTPPLRSPEGFLALGLTDRLSTSSQVEYRVLCSVFIYRHTRQPSPSGNEKHTPHTPNISSYFSPLLPPKPGN